MMLPTHHSSRMIVAVESVLLTGLPPTSSSVNLPSPCPQCPRNPRAPAVGSGGVPETPRLELMEQDSKDSAQSTSTSSSSETKQEYSVSPYECKSPCL